eukprot:475836-Pelagomonas_calceolata.AAC.2
MDKHGEAGACKCFSWQRCFPPRVVLGIGIGAGHASFQHGLHPGLKKGGTWHGQYVDIQPFMMCTYASTEPRPHTSDPIIPSLMK